MAAVAAAEAAGAALAVGRESSTTTSLAGGANTMVMRLLPQQPLYPLAIAESMWNRQQASRVLP